MSKVHQYNPTFYYYTFGTYPAAVEMEPGDTIITPTVDSRNSDFQGNQIPLSMCHHDPGNPPCEVNPLGGPFPVEGVQAGDSLRVTVKRIEMIRDYAVSRFSAGYGGARDEGLLTVGFMSYYEPLPDTPYQWEMDVDKGECTLVCGRKATVPLRPFLGTIGTAPRFGESLSPLVPPGHGGNMDCQGITEGAVLFLPVFAEEGAPDAGRCPCGTRDGELCGVALETAARGEITVDLVRGMTLDFPRVENETHWMTIGGGKSLTDAIKIALAEMVTWLEDDFKISRWERLQVVSQGCQIRVGNVVNPSCTAALKLSKNILF